MVGQSAGESLVSLSVLKPSKEGLQAAWNAAADLNSLAL